jgi:hypothetical protein
MPKPPNSSWNLFTPVIIPSWMRGPDEPTEYDLAAKALGPDELTAWIRKWYWTKYVPEDVLIKMGLAERY